MIPQPGTPEEIIHNALSETFENLVFEEVVLSEVVAGKLPEIALDGWWTRIKLIDPPRFGYIVLMVPMGLMNRFTEAILGLFGEQPTEEQNADNLGELLNTLCGRLMAMRSSPDKTFKMGLPEIGHGMSPEMAGPYRCVDCLVGEDHVYLLAPEYFWDNTLWEIDKIKWD
jgi:hypothetical protein